MPSNDEPGEKDTVFSPGSQGGGQRVRLERPVTQATVDATGRDPDGPKTAKFNPDDIPDADVTAAVDSTTGKGRGETPGPRARGRDDKALQRFLES